MKNLSQLATSVMRTVEEGQVVKAASLAYPQEELKTNVGQLMQKVAMQLRNEASTKITYADLARFRKAYDV